MGPATPPILCFSDILILPWGFRLLSSRLFGFGLGFFAPKQRFFVCFSFALQDPTPVSFVAGVSLSLSLLLFGCFVARRRRVSLSLLFRRWGNTNRAAVCGSPCVDLATLLVLDPNFYHRTYTTAGSSSCCFFVVLFCFRSRRRSLSFSLCSLSLSLFLV